MAQAFVREVVPPLFIDHRLRAFALYETEKIIAVSLCLVGTDSLCLWNGGFASVRALVARQVAHQRRHPRSLQLKARRI